MDNNPFKGSDQVFGGKENDPGEQRKQADQESTPTGSGGENDPGEQAKVVRPDLDGGLRDDLARDSEGNKGGSGNKSDSGNKPGKKKK